MQRQRHWENMLTLHEKPSVSKSRACFSCYVVCHCIAVFFTLSDKLKTQIEEQRVSRGVQGEITDHTSLLNTDHFGSLGLVVALMHWHNGFLGHHYDASLKTWCHIWHSRVCNIDDTLLCAHQLLLLQTGLLVWEQGGTLII